jgi:TPR repeat protein
VQQDYQKSLDYYRRGAQAGDLSSIAAILLAIYGFEVHLVDLPDKKSEFALWRLRRRGYRPVLVPVTNANPYPTLPKPADLVVTIHVWEHLRNPVRALNNIIAVTIPGKAYLMNTNGDFDHSPIGDHLPDGIREGKSDAYRCAYAEAWQDVGLSSPDAGRLFRRI